MFSHRFLFHIGSGTNPTIYLMLTGFSRWVSWPEREFCCLFIKAFSLPQTT
jgi:hypothetical protein